MHAPVDISNTQLCAGHATHPSLCGASPPTSGEDVFGGEDASEDVWLVAAFATSSAHVLSITFPSWLMASLLSGTVRSSISTSSTSPRHRPMPASATACGSQALIQRVEFCMDVRQDGLQRGRQRQMLTYVDMHSPVRPRHPLAEQTAQQQLARATALVRVDARQSRLDPQLQLFQGQNGDQADCFSPLDARHSPVIHRSPLGVAARCHALAN